MRNRDHKNGVPSTVASIPLVDPHAVSAEMSIGELVREATTQVSTLVRAEVELARAEITQDVKKGLSGSAFFIVALVVLLYSTFFLFFFLAELLDTWVWRWAAFLIVFALMLALAAAFALLGFLRLRRIRGPRQTIESVKETTAALTPSLSKFAGAPARSMPATPPTAVEAAGWAPASGPAPRPAVPAVAPAYEPAYEPASEPAEATVTYETTEATVTYEAYEPAVTYEPYEPYEPAVSYETTEATVTYEAYEAYEAYEPAVTSETTEATVTYETTEVAVAYDPTAAVYADTGLPVTSGDPLPGDSSGW